MTQNIWYTVARTSDSECTGRVLFSIGNSSLSFDVFIQFGNISISIVSAVVEADTVFSMRVRSRAGFYYVDVKSSREYGSSPSFSVDQILGTLTPVTFGIAGDGRQECIVSTDAWAPSPSGETYVTTDTIQAITALKYFEDGLAIGDRDNYWVLSYGSGGVFINGNRILVTSDLNNYATQSWVIGRNYITAAALTGYVNGGAYNSTTKNIELKHDSTVVAQIDATAFIKDGMVSSVAIENGYLVISFNTDAGKEDISIPLTDLFDPANYYTKTDINSLLGNYVTLNTSQVITAEKYFSAALAIPLSAPSSPTSGRTYLYAGSGAYAEEPSGGVADVFPLTITKNGSSWLSYDPATQAETVNLVIPTKVSDLTNDTGFITSSALSGYATQTWVEGKGYITSSALNGYATQSWVEGKGYITSSALDGYVNDFEVTGNGNAVTTGSKSGKKITLTKGNTFVDLTSAQTITGAKKHANVALLNIPATLSSADIESGKTYLYAGTGDYSVEPTGGVADVYTLTLKKGATSLGTYDPAGPDDQTIDLASAFSGYATESWVNGKGYLTSVAFSDLTSHPTTLNGYGITDAVSAPSSTDNHIARFDGSQGQIQNSDVAIDDSGDIISGHSLYLTNITSSVHTSGYSKIYFGSKASPYNYIGANTSGVFGIYNASQKGVSCYPTQNFFSTDNIDLGRSQSPWKNFYFNGKFVKGSYEYTWPSKSGTVALVGDIPTKLSDLTDDILSGYYLPIDGTAAAATKLATARSLWGQSFDGTADVSGDISSAGNITGTGLITMPKAKFSSSLIIPHAAPSGTLESGETYLYAGSGDYAEESSGGGVSDIYPLTITKNGSAWLSYDPATGATSANLSIGWSDLTPDASHRFLTDNLISTWNAKYDKPSGGIPATDLASAVQTSLGKADTALQNFTETDPTVPSWAKASTKPTYSLSEITGTDDLQAIEALSGTSGFLKKTAANTWGLDTHTYLTADDHKALTLKVGTTTVQADYNALAAKTYTISKQNLTDTIGNTTYAVYNADGYVPTTRKVNGHALSSDVTVTKGDVGLGNVENTALSTWAGTSNITTLGTITTGTWNGTAIANAYLANSSVTINGKSVSLGGSVSLNLDDIGDGTTKTWSRIVFTDTDQTITGTKKLKSVSLLNIPTSAPASADIESGKIYLYSSAGEYSETPSGSGTGDIYSLTVTKNGSPWLSYDPSSAAVSTNLTIGWSDLTEDSTHKFVSQAEKNTWNAIASTSTLGNIKVGSGLTIDNNGVLTPYVTEDSMLVLANDGTLGVNAEQLIFVTQSIVEGYGYATTSAVNTAVAALTPKTQAIPYIVGPSTDATAGTWTGTYEGITALTEGLTIVYVPHVAGATTTTLNINGLGAKTCYWTGTSKMTTQYPVGTPILLTYHNNGWRRADANTTYSAGTKALFDAGTNTSNRVWSASVLASAVAPIVHEHDWQDINNAPAFITADALSGYATETYVGNQITALNLGTASQKDYVTSITSGGTDLPTAGAIYTYVNNAVTAAQPYKGVSSTAITDGGTEMPTISGYTTRTKGDVVAYNKKEFIWEGDKWRELGDEGSYALKTVQVIAGTGLTGGGAISQDITLSLSSATQASLALANSALQSSDLDGYVNAISQGSGNYVTGITKSGKTLTISRSTLPTTIAWTNVTGRPTALSDFTDDILSGHYLPLSAGYDYPLTDVLYSQSIIPTADVSYSLGTDTRRFGLGYFFFLLSTAGQFSVLDSSALLSIPQVAPDTTDDFYDSTKTYLYASSLGEYSETPGGGTGDIYALTITKNGSAWLSYNPGVAAVSANLTIGWSDLTPDANHRFLTDTLISTWNGKQDAISDLSTIRTNAGHGNTAYGWGDHSQAGYLTSYTETDPVFSASAAAGITSSNISTWNGKYTKPSTGIPKTDLASAVQTTLTNADTAYGWGNHASAGYLTSSSLDGYVNEIATGTGDYISGVSKSGKKLTFTYGTLPTTIAWGSVTGKPTTISGYGITDAKIETLSGTSNRKVTLGSNNFTIYSWALASAKPSYALSEITGADDLKAIEALTGTGLAKRTADNTWELTDTADKAEKLVTSTEEDAMFTSRQVPSVALGDVCKVTSVKGKSIVWNQLVDTGTTSVTIPSGHRYYAIINGVRSVGTSTGAAIAVTGGTDMVFDLTLMFGTTIAASMTAADFEAIYPLPYYDYNYGELVNNAASGVEMLDAGGTSLGTLSTPITEIVPADKSTVRLNQLVVDEDISKSIDGAECLYDAATGLWSYENLSRTTKFQSGSSVVKASQGFSAGHKIYIWADSQEPGICVSKSNAPAIAILPGTIATVDRNGYYFFLRVTKDYDFVTAHPIGNVYQFRLMFIDLTEMYGAGNEPTSIAEVEELIGTDYIPYNTGEDIPNRIFPVGMKSAGSVADEWSGTTATKRIGSRAYQSGDENDSSVVTDGTTTYYPLSTPVTYTVDALPDTLVPFEAQGTQRRLPVDTSEDVAAPIVCDFQYGANMSDVAKAYLPLSGGTVTGTLEAAGELIIPDSAPRNPDSTKVYLYCDTTGNYYQS